MIRTINPRAAAGDVGSESIYVSIAGGPARVFGTFTRHLKELRDCLLVEQPLNRRDSASLAEASNTNCSTERERCFQT